MIDYNANFGSPAVALAPTLLTTRSTSPPANAVSPGLAAAQWYIEYAYLQAIGIG